jgi:outer membrane protein OmpA-like peptidoglycan-associated protein
MTDESESVPEMSSQQGSRENTAPEKSSEKMDQEKFSSNIAVINFEFDSSKIRPTEYQHINKALGTVNTLNQQNYDYKLLVKGHTDRIGPAAYNGILGRKRAIAVAKLLVKRGIEKSLIETRSFGEREPMVMAQDWERRSLNRRAVIQVVPKEEYRQEYKEEFENRNTFTMN